MSEKNEYDTIFQNPIKSTQNYILKIILPAFQIQIALLIGVGISLIISLFYFVIKDMRLPNEDVMSLFIGFLLPLSFWLLGTFGQKLLLTKKNKLKLSCKF
jgi:hypothetical protein